MNIIHSYNLYNLVFYFTIYSFLGWCVEVSYYFKNEKRFVNRGFLNGPFCPIYGSSIVLLVVLLENFKDNLVLLFILSFFVTSIIEYITGYVLEKLFNDKWWDYSTDPLNLHGRVCFLYSLIWGAGATFLIVVIHPIIKNIIENIPHLLGTISFFTIIIYFLIDFAVTLGSLNQFNFYIPRIEFASYKPNFSVFNKERTYYKMKNFEYVLEKFINDKKRIFKNFSDTHTKSISSFVSSLKDIIKKD